MVEKDCVEGPLASQLLYWHIFWSCQEMWNKSIIHPQFHISHRIWHTKYSFSKVIQKYLCQNVREWEIQIFKKVPKCEYLLSAEEKIWKPLFEFKPDIDLDSLLWKDIKFNDIRLDKGTWKSGQTIFWVCLLFKFLTKLDLLWVAQQSFPLLLKNF